MKNGFVIFIFCFFHLYLLSQTDTTKLLREVEISASRSRIFNPGIKIIQLDSSFLSQFSTFNLAEALSYDGTIALKQYGPGGLTSTALRGGSASHTTVVWNGFNIQNPMHGMVDLNLFPLGASDNISIQYGAGASQWGSGAVSGAIILENKPLFNSGWNAGLNSSVSSFNTYANQLQASYGNNSLSVIAKAYFNRSENNFSFRNTTLSDAPIIRQDNAATEAYGGTVKLTARVKSVNIFDLNVWYHESHREIPPLMFQSKSLAFQNDNGLKLSAEWKRIFKRSVLTIRTGLFKDFLNYNDSLSALFSKSNSSVSISEAEYTMSKKRLTWQTGLNFNYAVAISDGYSQTHSQWRNALYTLLKIYSPDQRKELHISLRKEMIDDKVVYPSLIVNNKKHNYEYLPTASLGFDLAAFKWLGIKANISTIYRVPTLNDLYWNPGGNKDLKPEEGTSEELTITSKINIRKITVQYNVTGFNRNVRNWIIWLPGETYWSPENVMRVWSRGFEHMFRTGYSKNKFEFNLIVNYTFTLSTNEKEKGPGDASLYKQLIYMPVHEGAAKLNFVYNRWFIYYMHSYLGYRYTSTDNKEFIPEYDIARLSVGKTIAFKRIDIALGAFCNNLYNEEYQSVLWHAMPGRSFGFSLKLNLKQNQ